MKQSSVFAQFFHYVSLNIIGTLGLSCYILADTFFIANRLGSDGLAALNLALPVYNLIFGIAVMLGFGGAANFTIYRAQGKEQRAQQTFTAVLLMVAAASVIFELAGLFFSVPLTALLGAGPDIFQMTCTYLRILLFFAPAFLLNNLMAHFTRNDGAPKLTMIASLASSSFNILFDYVFLYPLDMGIRGAILATGISPLVSLLIISTRIFRRKNGFHLVPGVIPLRVVSRCLSTGFPSLISELSGGVVMVVMNYLFLRLGGTVSVAAYGVIANLAVVVLALYNGVAQGAQPLCSQAYGRRDGTAAYQVLRYALVTVLILSPLLYGGIALWAEPIAAAFNSAQNVTLQAQAVEGLRLYFTGVAFAGFNLMLSMFFSATGKPLSAQIISLCRGVAVIVPMAILLAEVLGRVGVWLSFPAAEGVVVLMGIFLLLYHKGRECTIVI